MPKKARSKQFFRKKRRQGDRDRLKDGVQLQLDENDIGVLKFITAPVDHLDQQPELKCVPEIRKNEVTQSIHPYMSSVQMDHDYLAVRDSGKLSFASAASSVVSPVLQSSRSSAQVHLTSDSVLQKAPSSTAQKLPAISSSFPVQTSQSDSELKGGNSGQNVNSCSLRFLSDSVSDDIEAPPCTVSQALSLSVEGGLPTVTFQVAPPFTSDGGESDVLKITKFPVGDVITMENPIDSSSCTKENVHRSENPALSRYECEENIQNDDRSVCDSNISKSLPVIISSFTLPVTSLHCIPIVSTQACESLSDCRKTDIKLVRKISPSNALKPAGGTHTVLTTGSIRINTASSEPVENPSSIDSFVNTDLNHSTSALVVPTSGTNQSLPTRGKLFDVMSNHNRNQIKVSDKGHPCPYYTNDINCTTVKVGEFIQLMGAQVTEKYDVHRFLLGVKEKLEPMLPNFWSVLLNTWGFHCAWLSPCKNIQAQRSVVVQLSGKMQIFALGRYLPKGHELRELVEQKSLDVSDVDLMSNAVVDVVSTVNSYNLCRAVHRHKEYWMKMSDCYEEMCSNVEKTLRSDKCELLIKNVVLCTPCKQMQARLKSVVARYKKGTSEFKDNCCNRFMTEDQLREKLKKQTREIRRQNKVIVRLREKLNIPQKSKDQTQQDVGKSDNQDLEDLLFGGSDSDFEWPDEDGEAW